LSIREIIKTVRERTGSAPNEIVDFFVTASGFSWVVATELLLAENIITRPLPAETIQKTQAARMFWILFAEGRARYSVAADHFQFHQPSGDWGFFSHAQLEALLPGMVLADHFQRREYFANYVVNAPALDLFTVTKIPLVRHPFSRDDNLFLQQRIG
jgi:hypothetical protein